MSTDLGVIMRTVKKNLNRIEQPPLVAGCPYSKVHFPLVDRLSYRELNFSAEEAI